MADVFAEVDEAMRQERIMTFWKKHGVLIVTFLVLLIVGTACVSAYRAWDSKTRIEQTNILLDALDPEKIDQTDFAALSKDLRPGLRGITLLIAGGQKIESGNADEAINFYQMAAADKSIPSELHDLAVLMVVRLQSQKDDATSQSAALLSELQPIWSNEKSPWALHARLEAAILEAHLSKNYSEAQNHLNLILRSENAPQTLKDRARALGHVYALKNTNEPAKENDESTEGEG